MNTGEWMTVNKIDKWLLENEPKSDNKIWLVCPKEGCDNRPFYVSQSEIDEAEGEIWCDNCDTPCVVCEAPM